VQQFTKDHDRCAEAMRNVVAHCFGNHANCRKFEAPDEDGALSSAPQNSPSSSGTSYLQHFAWSPK
jgi:hypothetical protein